MEQKVCETIGNHVLTQVQHQTTCGNKTNSELHAKVRENCHSCITNARKQLTITVNNGKHLMTCSDNLRKSHNI